MNKRNTVRAAIAAAVLLLALCGCSSAGPEAQTPDVNTLPEEQVIAENQPASSADAEAEQAEEIDEGDRFGGHRYELLSSNGADWQELKEACEAQGGYLASITSEGENDFLYELSQKYGEQKVLFGLYRDAEDGEWKWVSGEPAEYFNWQEGEPNNTTGVEFYGMFYPDFEEGKWNDGDQNDIEWYICEWE